jgi:hypothetical protein
MRLVFDVIISKTLHEDNYGNIKFNLSLFEFLFNDDFFKNHKTLIFIL